MNNIQEKDWADESWHGHTGLDSSCDYCIVNEEVERISKDNSEAGANEEGIIEQE
jgi:hypothetical protein